MIIAGEPSGDMHAAKLVANLENENFKFYGMGGHKMQEQGVFLVENIDKTAVMGIFEVINKLPYLYKILFKIIKLLKTNPPDLLILVDFQSFNLKLAKAAKKLNIKTLFYISPQVWAWRRYRVKKIKKTIENMAVIFPFEVDFYKNYGMTVNFVGHPLLENKLDIKYNKDEFLKIHQINNNKKIIALLPGSRYSEIILNMPIFLDTIVRLGDKYQFLLSHYDANNSKLKKYFNNLPPQVKIIEKDFYSMLNASDFALVASGTATLECALLKTPMLVVAKVSSLSYLFYKRMIKIPFISIVNIIAGKKIVVELIQEQANVKNICFEIEDFLNDNTGIKYERMQNDFKDITKKLKASPECNLKQLVLKLLND
jgi:lipid-A-disaccharide synthase